MCKKIYPDEMIEHSTRLQETAIRKIANTLRFLVCVADGSNVPDALHTHLMIWKNDCKIIVWANEGHRSLLCMATVADRAPEALGPG